MTIMPGEDWLNPEGALDWPAVEPEASSVEMVKGGVLPGSDRPGQPLVKMGDSAPAGEEWADSLVGFDTQPRRLRPPRAAV